ncbi:MAG: N-6 DNA methylase [Burkholderiaceae bacterium]|jgi:type I restriction-modification system DNA methylase subunit/restriction endonuclease S subunit|nr:N-6 DNA methylase [Burkholderiaceae bacterium]
MLTSDNLPDLLAALGFQKKGATHSKTIGDALIEVNFVKKTISYPESAGLIVNERQTCNFEADENFVVLECVHRLLEKGYKPEHIELEPKWKLGHGASGGRADILIKNFDGKPLLIIECKTAGREFTSAWNATKRDGDQLFSYAQQIAETQFLCLYTADWINGALVYTSHVIAHRDNPDYLAANPQFRSFKDATDVKERFAVWRDTYKFDYTTKGIFEDNIQSYQIGKEKYSLADLNVIATVDQQKKYHEFATILRQHNVSGRENAFDKLVNLFLCKLVDETSHPLDLKFYWKGVAYDTHFDLLDRLQQLYQAGMKEFLGEEITYIDRAAVLNAMRYIKQNPDATQNTVWNLFLQQKFFTNNDFSFIDVHNERLFYQNADVLLKILQMWQDIRLTGGHQNNQFLGDLFEGFLDRGVKQSEGQFFTPGPICRFILSSLPLESLLKSSAKPLRSIDYACGAGHFLTELASQLHDLLPADAPLDEWHKAIYGIEKEYRLSKVAKVSAFMYGQKYINICYGDALVKHHAAFPDIRDGSFDLLVANPPYSVRGFFDTLPEEERPAYALAETIKDAETANSIETFFVERAKQLLAAGGVAAIILPASILSNGGSVYVRTREILIQYFDIVAIAEFGSGTFGKTGTNTVTLFLRRKRTAPEAADHYRERVDEWFGTDENQPVYKDEHLIDAYAAHIGVPPDDYKTLLKGAMEGAWDGHGHFAAYIDKFNASAEVATLYKAKWFKALSEKEQTAEINRRYLAFVQTIERDKLFHFVMVSDQPNPVLLIRSPTETKAIRKFLGYGWSDAKGNEGIQTIRDGNGNIITALYDEADRRNADKLNRLIADNFDGVVAAIPATLSEYATTVRLVDLLDFSRTDFEKQIVFSVKKEAQQSKWPMQSLDDIVEIIAGQSPESEHYNTIKNGLPFYQGKKDFGDRQLSDPTTWTTKANKVSAKGDILFSVRAPVGDVNMNPFKEICIGRGLAALRPTKRVLGKFLFEYIANHKDEFRGSSGATFESITSRELGLRRLPFPPSEIQQQIVAECEAIDAETDKAQAALAAARQSIDAKVEAIYASNAPRQTVDSLALAIQYGLNEKMNEEGRGYRIFRMNEIVAGRMVDNGAMKYADISADEFAKYKLNRGDLLFIRSNGSLEHIGKVGRFDLEGDYCYASYLVRTTPDQTKVFPQFLAYMMSSMRFRKEMVGLVVKSGGTNNINATKMRNLKVPVSTLTVQRKFVAEIEALERKIAEAEAVINSAPVRKNAVLQKYL